jgi:hypothetical protein
LKSLGKRRKTPSELSKELNLATSTVVEHLDRLEEADLIRREETGHKWIYYNLTEKGLALVKPRVPTNFIIVLGMCFFVIFIGFLYYYNLSYANFAGVARPDMLTVPTGQKTTEGVKETKSPGETEGTGELPATAATGSMTNATNVTNLTCIDSDGGKDYYTKGSLDVGCPERATCGIFFDYCRDNVTLVENFCVNKEPQVELFNCTNGCKDGTCS